MKHNKGSLVTSRPFTSSHHSASGISPVGGSSYPHPREFSIAHRGVLFLDELTEFKRDVMGFLCQPHEMDPNLAAGGAFVTWDGSMAWDKNDENHKGSTVFAIVPDPENPRKGKMLREGGYAEIAPVVGLFEMDDEDGLNLIKEYETMSSIERFWLLSPNLRMGSSAVKRFGGFNTSTLFCFWLVSIAEVRS